VPRSTYERPFLGDRPRQRREVPLRGRRRLRFGRRHTEVDDAYEGQGIGSTLAKSALDAARREERTVVPHCPFIKSYIDRHSEYADLL
jgi:predicted GNAT family acetyltransferase